MAAPARTEIPKAGTVKLSGASTIGRREIRPTAHPARRQATELPALRFPAARTRVTCDPRAASLAATQWDLTPPLVKNPKTLTRVPAVLLVSDFDTRGVNASSDLPAQELLLFCMWTRPAPALAFAEQQFCPAPLHNSPYWCPTNTRSDTGRA